MFNSSKLSNAIRTAVTLGVAGTATLTSVAAVAQEADTQEVERIAITGSSIQRVDMEGALPVTLITAADIARTGVTSVPQLIQTIPAMQGFLSPSRSVGGGGGGQATASLKGLGSAYTLTLLNGKRLAGYADGSAVDIKSIPIAAIKRVEILTDGAAAVYGSDAIAGVVNFILRDDIQEASLAVRTEMTEHGGGENTQFQFTAGTGDLEKDGYNVFATFTHTTQERLSSQDRGFASTGFIPFTYEGNNLITADGSSNAIPANALVTYNVRDAAGNLVMDDEGEQVTGAYGLNPYRILNGGCAVNNVPSATSDNCVFDYTSTIELMPEYTLDNVMFGGKLALSDNAELYTTVTLTKDVQTARIAPYPTGRFGVPMENMPQDLWDAVAAATVEYNLGTDEAPEMVVQDPVADAIDTKAQWRMLPGGNRTNEYENNSVFVDFGVRGSMDEMTYDLSVTYSQYNTDETIITGYPVEAEIWPLLESGSVPLFRPIAEWDQGSIDAVAGAMYSGMDASSESSTLAIEGKGSLPIYELPAGDVYLGFGFDYRTQEYVETTSQDNKDQAILWASIDPEYDMSRDRYAVFVESVVPVADNLEVTVAGRYDSISAIDSDITLWEEGVDAAGNPVASEAGTYGETMDDFTYKVSASYRPSDQVLMRGSFGTGFRAPSMRSIAQPAVPFGVTGSEYGCTYAANDPRADLCQNGTWQWDQFQAGNVALQPETSQQVSLGVVVSPSENFNFSIDWWDVALNDLIRSPSANQIVNDPDTYSDLHTSVLEQGTGQMVPAIILTDSNVTRANYEGIDYRFEFMNEFGDFTVKSIFSGTRMLKSEDQNVADPKVFDSNLGMMGPNEDLVFENQMLFQNTIQHGKFTHGLNMTFRSGYQDTVYSSALYAESLERSGIDVQLDVESYMKLDYTLSYSHSDNLEFLFGINNILDEEPPFSLGYPGGHQVGYNARYYDVTQRSAHLSVQYTF